MLGTICRACRTRVKVGNSVKTVSKTEHQKSPISAQRGGVPILRYELHRKWHRSFCSQVEGGAMGEKRSEGTFKVSRSRPPRYGHGSAANEPETLYSHDRVHQVPVAPHLWSSGVVERAQFPIFLTDLLSQQNWSAAARLWAQLVYQTHQEHHINMTEYVNESLRDRLPAEPLPSLSEIELFSVFIGLHFAGFHRHALALWQYYDTANTTTHAAIKPHVYYYSKAFHTGPFTQKSDVRNVSLLVNVLETAHTLKEKALVASIFERLTGGLIDDLTVQKVPKSEIPNTPLWHVSYSRQLRVLELALINLDLQTQAPLVLTYLNTYRLKFAMCWTPQSLLKFYALLAACKKYQPSLEMDTRILEESIKQYSYKIATQETLQAIRNEDVLTRVRQARSSINFSEMDPNVVYETIEKGDGEAKTQHPGIINLIARAIELSTDPSKAAQSYHIVKQIYLECFEVPHFFHDMTSIAEPALKHFILGNDALAVAWLYQMMIEQNIGMSAHVRTLLMQWALHHNNDAKQCIEFFNDLLVSLGPQAANGATMLVLIEAVQQLGDLSAAKNILTFIRERTTSRSILKQVLDVTFSLALQAQDDATLQSLADEMATQAPTTYSELWQPKLAEYLKRFQRSWSPPVPSQIGSRVSKPLVRPIPITPNSL